MVNEEKYLLVAESIAPEIFKKVLEAKKYIATGKAANSSEAVRLANISRSAFYKYKDRVMEYNSRESNAIVTFYMTMEDVPGVLSSVINHLAEYGANILTINQNIPSDGVAAVTISIRMTDVTLEEEQLLQRLCPLPRGELALRLLILRAVAAAAQEGKNPGRIVGAQDIHHAA